MLLLTAGIVVPTHAVAEQASQPTSPMAGQLDVSGGGGDSSGHTCAVLAHGSVRCWGFGGDGRLGYCNTNNVGDHQTPGSVGPVDLLPGRGAHCGGGRGGPKVNPLGLEALRAERLHSCLTRAARRPKRQRSRAGACLKRYGRTPGRITKLRARASSRTTVILTFAAPASDGQHPPAARAYLVKQSRRPIRGEHDFQNAHTLCSGRCRFKVTTVGMELKLTIVHLQPHSTYYYALAARDNVSNRRGPRSPTIEIRTR